MDRKKGRTRGKKEDKEVNLVSKLPVPKEFKPSKGTQRKLNKMEENVTRLMTEVEDLAEVKKSLIKIRDQLGKEGEVVQKLMALATVGAPLDIEKDIVELMEPPKLSGSLFAVPKPKPRSPTWRSELLDPLERIKIENEAEEKK